LKQGAGRAATGPAVRHKKATEYGRCRPSTALRPARSSTRTTAIASSAARDCAALFGRLSDRFVACRIVSGKVGIRLTQVDAIGRTSWGGRPRAHDGPASACGSGTRRPSPEGAPGPGIGVKITLLQNDLGSARSSVPFGCNFPERRLWMTTAFLVTDVPATSFRPAAQTSGAVIEGETPEASPFALN